MSGADVLRLLHVASAFWFVAGLIGRDLVLARARRSEDLRQVRELLAVSAPFERLMVIPGSVAVPAFGLLTGGGRRTSRPRSPPRLAIPWWRWPGGTSWRWWRWCCS
ncbi:MAG TPA: hypothetical protein VF129_13220 [Actinomycetota bacterium]